MGFNMRTKLKIQGFIAVSAIRSELNTHFPVKDLGPLHDFLGMEIHRNFENNQVLQYVPFFSNSRQKVLQYVPFFLSSQRITLQYELSVSSSQYKVLRLPGSNCQLLLPLVNQK